MIRKDDVVIVGGGVMGASAAYWLSRMGRQVTVIEQGEVPNRLSASGDQLRIFRLSYGKDAFYTEMAAQSRPLWRELVQQGSDKFFIQNGFLDLATQAHGYEEASLKVLKEHKIPAVVLDKDDLKRHYPMLNSRAFRFGLLHKDG